MPPGAIKVKYPPGSNFRQLAKDIGAELTHIQSFVNAVSYGFTGAAMLATTGAFGTTVVTTFTSTTGHINDLTTQNMVSTTGYISNLFVDNYSVKDLSIGIYVPTSATGTIGTISVNTITGASSYFTTITGTQMYCDYASLPILTGTSAFFSTITGTTLQIASQIFSSTGIFTYSNSNTGRVRVLQADNYAYPAAGSIDNLQILDTITGSSVFTTHVTGGNIFCDNLTVSSAYFTEITGVTVVVPYLNISSITGTTAEVNTLTGTNFYSSTITSSVITGTNISTSILTSSTLTGSNLYFSSTLKSSSITGNNIYSTQTTVPSINTDVVTSYTSGGPTTIVGTKFLSSTVLSMRRLLTRSMLAARATTSWTTGTAASNMGWVSVCWSPENGLFTSVAPGPRVQTSSNGVSWSLKSGGAFNWNDVCWSPEENKFVACAYGGSVQFMYSSDGNTWTANTTLFPASPHSICYSSDLGLFCAIDPTLSQSVISPNGLAWTSYSVANMVDGRICWSSELNLFCAVGSLTPYALISSNGQTWTPAMSIYAGDYTGVCWAAELNLFCAVGINIISTSPDGLTWTSQTSPIAGASWFNVAWSPELKVFAATSTAGVGYSSDGIIWNSSSIPQSNSWRGICWSKALGVFCLVSSDGTNRVMISRYVKKCY